jgi:hypothetical protein
MATENSASQGNFALTSSSFCVYGFIEAASGIAGVLLAMGLGQGRGGKVAAADG